MSSTIEWFEDFISKTDKSDFRQDTIPDVMELWVHDEDTVFAKWDLTQELREKGASITNYSNSSLNINLTFMFFHKDLAEKYKDDDALRKILERALNDSLKHGANWTSTTSASSGGKGAEFYLFMGLGSIALLLGLVGLAIKLRASHYTKVVRITRICGSLMCIMAAIIVIIEEAMNDRAILGQRKVYHFTVEAASIVIGVAANALGKAFLLSWKVFTFIIYIFQNIMLYRPFLFREHKKALGKWFLRASLVQSFTLLAYFSVWAIYLILATSDLCDEIIDSSRKWNVALIIVGSIGYSGSLLLSIIFVVGYYRSNVNGLRKSEAKNVGKTMLSCSIEVLFDLVILLIYSSGHVPCLSFNPYHTFAFSLENQLSETSKCDISFKWTALDFGLTRCTMFFLYCQPVLQELFFVLSELIGCCSMKNCWKS